MRRIVLIHAALSALLLPASTQAQGFDAPVLYENDFLSADFHRSRRDAVRAALPVDAIAVLFGAPQRNRSNDVDYEYRQSSDFLYLTGTTEPGSALIMAPSGITVDGLRVQEVLFVPPRDPAHEVWEGRRFGTSRAMERLGVEMALEATRFEEVLGTLLSSGEHRVFHLPLPQGVEPRSELAGQISAFLEHTESVDVAEGNMNPHAEQAPAEDGPDGSTLRGVLDRLRTVKTEEEMILLQRAIDITAEAHREVMKQLEAGWAEYEIEALIEYTFKRNGAEYPGFPSIVASGENSVILHYGSNRKTTESGEVIVIDVGAEYHGYSADVTRTIPVDGAFSPEQRKIYELVYAAQEAGIEATQAGVSFRNPHAAATRVLLEGMAELGLIDGPTDLPGLRRFFMHGTSHYLGLDVHDVSGGGPMQPGTVITVEPGIYIPAAADIDPKWWNIGVRIEDDVLVTEAGPVILSTAAPRQIDEVEALMQGRPIS
jgi:Xaa-Pro aminopeptidase